MKGLGFVDADWSLDQALIWIAAGRVDLVNEASDDPFVPPERRLRWATFLLRDDTGGVPRAEIEQKLLQAIKQGDVSSTVDGEPVDPRVYSPAQYVMGLDGVAFRWTDQVPFLTNTFKGDARHERRHQRELRPRLEIADLVRLHPGRFRRRGGRIGMKGVAASVEPVEPGELVSFTIPKRKIGDMKAFVAKRKAMEAVWEAVTATQKGKPIASAREGKRTNVKAQDAPPARSKPARISPHIVAKADENIRVLNYLQRHYKAALEAGERLTGEHQILKALQKRSPDQVAKIGANRLRTILGGRVREFTRRVDAGEYVPWWPYPPKKS